MRWKSRLRRVTLAGAILAVGVMLAQLSASAQVAKEDVAERIAAEYGVQVLRVRLGEIGETPVWLVTVMKPGGDSNDAFQVTTLAADLKTGQLVSTYQHGVHGAEPSTDPLGTRIEQRPEQMRSGTWR